MSAVDCERGQRKRGRESVTKDEPPEERAKNPFGAKKKPQVALFARSWLRHERGAFTARPCEFDDLWAMRPEEPQYISLFGKRCQRKCRSRFFAAPGTSYTYSGMTVEGEAFDNATIERAVRYVQVPALMNESIEPHPNEWCRTGSLSTHTTVLW